MNAETIVGIIVLFFIIVLFVIGYFFERRRCEKYKKLEEDFEKEFESFIQSIRINKHKIFKNELHKCPYCHKKIKRGIIIYNMDKSNQEYFCDKICAEEYFKHARIMQFIIASTFSMNL